jgi:CubicO group peptidase (beta-lactamase class C family)
MTPREMVALGELFRVGGRGIVPAEYVRAATTAASGGGFPEGTPYGLHWWVSRESGCDAFFAAGFGGQYVYVVPALELTVATVADPTVPARDQRDVRPLIARWVASAGR